ncbi:hypothetical protein B0H13DRAFT_1872821 [Mycena leptocephala]|nr:hypothetical protein B0H13DRAFT_1872821 [Mycena leptocephala]
MPSWISLRIGVSAGSIEAAGSSVEDRSSGEANLVAISEWGEDLSEPDSVLRSNGIKFFNGGLTSNVELVLKVKIGLDDPGSFAVTTSFLGETERETEVEICPDLGLSRSSSSRSRLIARAAEALVGANKRNLAGSRCGVGWAKGRGPLAR